jgi:hypothetical protein
MRKILIFALMTLVSAIGLAHANLQGTYQFLNSDALLFDTTWNPLDKSTNIILTNGNLKAQSTAIGQFGARGTTSLSASKIYVEFKFSSSTLISGAGIATGTAGLGSDTFNTTNNCFEVIWDGISAKIWFNGAQPTSPQNQPALGAINNDIIGMAINFSSSLGWFRKNGGDWNADATADPATNTRGIDISALFPTNAAFLSMGTGSVDASVIMNAGASAFSFTPPSGYIDGWP